MTEDPPDGRRLLIESPPPQLDVVRGYAVSDDAEELLRRFEAEPHTEPVDLGGYAPGVRVHRWRLDPGIAEVAAAQLAVVEGAARQTPAGSYLVDSRDRAAHLQLGEAGLELRIERGHVSLFAPVGSGSLPTFEHRIATEGEALEGWLAEHVAALGAAADPVDCAAAPGALVRFWTPSVLDDPAQGPPAVVRAARAWARALEAGRWETLERDALARARALEEQLDALGVSHLADNRLGDDRLGDDRLGERGTGEVDVGALAEARDVLESVAVTARLAGRGQDLRARLSALDARARGLLTAMTELRPDRPPSPRLRAVSWSEPEAWWGAVAT